MPEPRTEIEHHVHQWEVEYLPDPMAAGGVVRSGDLFCHCGETVVDAPVSRTPAWCLCGVVDDTGNGTCGNCGLRIMTDEDDRTRPGSGAAS